MSKNKKKKNKKQVSGQVSMNRVRKIFLALGFQTAAKWDAARLQKKLLKLKDLVEGAELDKKTQKRVNEILRAQSRGMTVRVIDVDDVAADKKREQAVNKALSTAKKSKSKTTKKKPGVVAAIIECLQNGPITKKDILKKLTKKFPDRPAEGMKRTINVFVPSRLINDKGLAVRKDKDGKFFIKGRPAAKSAKSKKKK